MHEWAREESAYPFLVSTSTRDRPPALIATWTPDPPALGRHSPSRQGSPGGSLTWPPMAPDEASRAQKLDPHPPVLLLRMDQRWGGAAGSRTGARWPRPRAASANGDGGVRPPRKPRPRGPKLGCSFSPRWLRLRSGVLVWLVGAPTATRDHCGSQAVQKHRHTLQGKGVSRSVEATEPTPWEFSSVNVCAEAPFWLLRVGMSPAFGFWAPCFVCLRLCREVVATGILLWLPC